MTNHFFKMLMGFTLLLLIGIGGLVYINHIKADSGQNAATEESGN